MQIETTPELVNLVLRDWEGARRTHLESVPRSATIGEIVSEAVRSMGLPFQSFYQALFRGRELPSADTLEELGIESDAEIELLPEVTAGKDADPVGRRAASRRRAKLGM